MNEGLVNIPAEQALLGAVLVNNDAFHRVDDLIREEHFGEPLHRMLWAKFSERIHAGGRVDHRLITAAMGSEAHTTPIGELTAGQYVARLAAEATTIVNATDYAASIIDYWRRGRLLAIGTDLVNRSAPRIDGEELSEVIADAERDLASVEAGSAEIATVSIAEAAGAALSRSRTTRESGGTIAGTTYGLIDLDAATGGMMPGNLVILGARPGMGKTSLALGAAISAARSGAGVGLISLETPSEDLASRAVTDMAYDRHGSIAYQAIINGTLDDRSFDKLEDSYETLRGLPLSLTDRSSLTLAMIRSSARLLKDRMARDGVTLKVVMIDHIGLVTPSDRYRGDRTREMTELSAGLKALAKDLQICVVALCQLNRKVEERQDKRPFLSDLRESGSIEQDADVVMFLYREHYYLTAGRGEEAADLDRQAMASFKEHDLELIIAKQRNGPCKSIMLFVDIASSAVRNAARRM